MEQSTNKRIEYIDALRGVTMILVVYSHVAYWCLNNIDMAYNDIFIRFRMPTFFFISGWVFYKADRIWYKSIIYSTLKKKFMVQIVPFLIFMYLYMYLFNGSEYYMSSAESKHGYWFTFSLFEYFIIYILFEALFNKHSSNKKEAVVMIVMLLLSILAFYYEQVKNDYLPDYCKSTLIFLSFSKIKYIIFFWLGTFVKKISFYLYE